MRYNILGWYPGDLSKIGEVDIEWVLLSTFRLTKKLSITQITYRSWSITDVNDTVKEGLTIHVKK